MEIIAFDSTLANPPPVVLGSPIAEYWVSGFRSSQKRTIQVSRPINAAAPNLFDRLLRLDADGFAAQRSFTGPTAETEAMIFYRTHKSLVPVLAHIQFVKNGNSIWQRNCGIEDIQLVKLNGCTVGFSYSIIGGTPSLT